MAGGREEEEREARIRLAQPRSSAAAAPTPPRLPLLYRERGSRAGRARRSAELEAAELEAAKLEAGLHRTAAARGPSSCRRRARASAPPWPPSSPHCRGRRVLEVGRETGGSSRLGGGREGVGGRRGKGAALTAGRPPPEIAEAAEEPWRALRWGTNGKELLGVKNYRIKLMSGWRDGRGEARC